MQPGWLKEFFAPQPEEPADGDGDGSVSRRDFVKSGVVAGVAAGMAAGEIVAARAAEAQTANPLGGQWWPSPWGAKDERGANNRITQAKVMEAARLIKTGKVYPLGRVLERGIPLFGERLGGHVVIPAGRQAGRSALTSSTTTMSCSWGRSGKLARSSTVSATSAW